MKKLKILVDPRMELLTALQLVAGDPNINCNSKSIFSDFFLDFFIKDQFPNLTVPSVDSVNQVDIKP